MDDDGILTLADGTKIDMGSGKPVQEYVKVPRHSEAVKEITERRRRLLDLPEPPETMNVISQVVAYSLIGLSVLDIARATSLTSEQIDNIKSTQAYSYMLNEMSQAIMERDADDIRTVFRQGAINAAVKVNGLVESENEAIALAAAKDMLDRDGFRPADVVEVRKKSDSTLRIEFISNNSDATKILEGELG